MTDPRYIRTIGLTLFAALLVVAPSQAAAQGISDGHLAAIEVGPVFMPMIVLPQIRNRDEVIQTLGTEYPADLREAGVGGRVVIWFYVTETGQNLHNRISQSSGQEQLDQAALRVADVFRFTPAMDAPPRGPGAMPNAVIIEEEPVAVPVWVEIPITFAPEA